MKTSSPAFATCSEPITKEQFLSISPRARFGIGGMRGTPQRRVVILATASALDVPLFRKLARAMDYELPLPTSALAAKGTARNAGWFTPENCSEAATDSAGIKLHNDEAAQTLQSAA